MMIMESSSLSLSSMASDTPPPMPSYSIQLHLLEWALHHLLPPSHTHPHTQPTPTSWLNWSLKIFFLTWAITRIFKYIILPRILTNNYLSNLLTPRTRNQQMQCFYCSNISRIEISKDSNVEWYCTNCLNWNQFDRNGEIIADRPEMYDTSTSLRTLQQHDDDDSNNNGENALFCKECLHNQRLVRHYLDTYPFFTNNASESEDLLDEDEQPAWVDKYEAYKRDLESRYPPVCEKCQWLADSVIQKRNRELMRRGLLPSLDVLERFKARQRQRLNSSSGSGKRRSALISSSSNTQNPSQSHALVNMWKWSILLAGLCTDSILALRILQHFEPLYALITSLLPPLINTQFLQQYPTNNTTILLTTTLYTLTITRLHLERKRQFLRQAQFKTNKPSRPFEYLVWSACNFVLMGSYFAVLDGRYSVLESVVRGLVALAIMWRWVVGIKLILNWRGKRQRIIRSIKTQSPKHDKPEPNHLEVNSKRDSDAPLETLFESSLFCRSGPGSPAKTLSNQVTQPSGHFTEYTKPLPTIFSPPRLQIPNRGAFSSQLPTMNTSGTFREPILQNSYYGWSNNSLERLANRRGVVLNKPLQLNPQTKDDEIMHDTRLESNLSVQNDIGLEGLLDSKMSISSNGRDSERNGKSDVSSWVFLALGMVVGWVVYGGL